MGQFQLNEDSLANASAVPKLFYNPNSWSQVANTLYVSQPTGVGFSYCTHAATSSECVNTDITAAEDAYDFFIAFFDAYPEFKRNPFYLSAESYGGVYIPLFMNEIKKRGGVSNFAGALIGNGCWGSDSPSFSQNPRWKVEHFFGHGMFDEPLYYALQKACGDWSKEAMSQPACQSGLQAMSDRIGSFDTYNIYDTCGRGTSAAETMAFMATPTVETNDPTDARPHPQLPHTETKVVDVSALGGAVNDYKCGGSHAAGLWLSEPIVQAALHVNASKPGQRYEKGPAAQTADLRGLYAELIGWTRLLIYSGDTDGCIPKYGTERWVRELDFGVRTPWHPWVSELKAGGLKQRAGYAIEFETKTNFTMVTIQGAGHMVPTFKPRFALTMLTKFLQGEAF